MSTEEDLCKTALRLAASAFDLIRLLNQTASRPQSEAARRRALELIGKLADAAQNLPTLVAQFGTNDWATPDMLGDEIALCEDALRQVRERMG